MTGPHWFCARSLSDADRKFLEARVFAQFQGSDGSINKRKGRP